MFHRETGDSNAIALLSGESPIAEARIGRNGDWELGVGNHTQQTGQFNHADWNWTTGERVAWGLQHDGAGGLSLFFGDTNNPKVTFAGDDLVGNALAFRARSTTKSKITFDSGVLSYDSTNVSLPLTSGVNLLSDIGEGGGSQAQYLFLFNDFLSPQFDAGNAWQLDGFLTFSWDGAAPVGSRVNFGVKVGEIDPGLQRPVPEPTSLAIFGLGGIGIVATGLRRRRR